MLNHAGHDSAHHSRDRAAMKIFEPQPSTALEVESGDADFPLPIADPGFPPMHRQCVMKGCSYRSPLLFAAGWLLAAMFFIIAVAIGLSGVSAQDALLRENALLIQALRERVSAPPAPPAPAEAATSITPVSPSPESPPPTPPARETPGRRRPALPKLPKDYTVPESEKWWNRP